MYPLSDIDVQCVCLNSNIYWINFNTVLTEISGILLLLVLLLVERHWSQLVSGDEVVVAGLVTAQLAPGKWLLMMTVGMYPVVKFSRISRSEIQHLGDLRSGTWAWDLPPERRDPSPKCAFVAIIINHMQYALFWHIFCFVQIVKISYRFTR